MADFGLAQFLDHSVTTHEGGLTVAYAAPEVFDDKATTQSDQYSLAVTYCELRGGRLPFVGSKMQIIKGHAQGAPDLSMLPAEERLVVRRALAKVPAERWPSCGAFVEALRRTRPTEIPVHDLPCPAPPMGIPSHGTTPETPEQTLRATLPDQRLARPAGGRSGRRWKVGVGASAVLGIGALVVWLVAHHRPEAPTGDGDVPHEVQNQGNQAAGPVTVAVLDFENHSKDPALDGFRLGLRDMLATDLSRVAQVKVVERSRLAAVLEEQKLTAGNFIDPRTAVRLGKGLAARALLTGSYVILGDDVRVDVRLVSVETGEIQLADAVSGSKQEFFRLQKALAEKVLAGLKVRATEQERQAEGLPQTKDFEAFRLYSAARLAQRQGRQKEAEEQFRQAVAKDPQFQLARRELAAVEAGALTRLAEAEKDRLARAGKIGQALEANLARHQTVVNQGRRVPAYFAALIVLSAHAGLLGDTAEVSKLVALEGRFFQEQVDSGNYYTFLEGFTNPKQYLKAELRDTLQWPIYAAFWPFDFDLREAFRVVHNDQGIKVDPSHFEAKLPHFAHDFLKRLIDDGDSKHEARLIEALRVQRAVLRYYAGWKGPPADPAQSIVEIQKHYLSRLRGKDPQAWAPRFVVEAASALEAVATSSPDAEVRGQANALLLQYVRQAKLNAGDKEEPAADNRAPAPAASAAFCSIALHGPRIVFLCEVARIDNLFAPVYVQQELMNAVRALSPAARFNIHLFGTLRRQAKATAFPEPQPAHGDALRTALPFIQGIPKSLDVVGDAPQQIDLGTALASVLTDWPPGEAGQGDVVIICYQDSPSCRPRSWNSFGRGGRGGQRYTS